MSESEEKTKIVHENRLIVFQSRKIRRIWHDDEWFFSVVDICGALTDSENPRDYWYKMKIRVKDEDGFEPSTVCRQLKLEAPDGKMCKTDCANTEGVFRIIQSIPSPKAEPFKRWLAKVGYERIEEIENPELAQERMKNLYEKKGYPKDFAAMAATKAMPPQISIRVERLRPFVLFSCGLSVFSFMTIPSCKPDSRRIGSGSPCGLLYNVFASFSGLNADCGVNCADIYFPVTAQACVGCFLDYGNNAFCLTVLADNLDLGMFHQIIHLADNTIFDVL